MSIKIWKICSFEILQMRMFGWKLLILKLKLILSKLGYLLL